MTQKPESLENPDTYAQSMLGIDSQADFIEHDRFYDELFDDNFDPFMDSDSWEDYPEADEQLSDFDREMDLIDADFEAERIANLPSEEMRIAQEKAHEQEMTFTAPTLLAERFYNAFTKGKK